MCNTCKSLLNFWLFAETDRNFFRFYILFLLQISQKLQLRISKYEGMLHTCTCTLYLRDSIVNLKNLRRLKKTIFLVLYFLTKVRVRVYECVPWYLLRTSCTCTTCGSVKSEISLLHVSFMHFQDQLWHH